jgi:acyl carrier protein
MKTGDLELRVRQVLTERLGIPAERITADSRLVDDLGVDSLDALELAMTLEETFHVGIDDKELRRVETVADVVLLVQALTENRAVASS